MMQLARERPGTAAQKGIGHRMQTALMGWVHQLGTLEYWEALLAGFEGLGPLVPILLAMVESFFPPLPLIAIVALNVAAHGGLLGFLYSWAGVALGGIIMFLFWRRLVKRFFWKVASRSPKLKGTAVGEPLRHLVPVHAVMLPSPILHALCLRDVGLWQKRYLRAVLLGKGADGGHDGAVFGRSGQLSEEPGLPCARSPAVGPRMYWVSKDSAGEASSGITRYCSGRKHLQVCAFISFCRKKAHGEHPQTAAMA